MKIKINNLIIISIVLIILLILIILILLILYNKIYKHVPFANDAKYTIPSFSTKPQPLDRTMLYGSLFLENLNKSIKNMSNPDIKYEEKRSELNNYSDILL